MLILGNLPRISKTFKNHFLKFAKQCCYTTTSCVICSKEKAFATKRNVVLIFSQLITFLSSVTCSDIENSLKVLPLLTY